MDRTDKVILEWYNKGWSDELYGSSSVVPTDTLITKAYILGATHASVGDDNRSFDYLSDYEILNIIRL